VGLQVLKRIRYVGRLVYKSPFQMVDIRENVHLIDVIEMPPYFHFRVSVITEKVVGCKEMIDLLLLVW
jgi:hypothetical protein